MPYRRRSRVVPRPASLAARASLASRVALAARAGVAAALVLGGVACAPGAPGDAAGDPSAPRLPLWELTHQGQTLYLLGSVHLLRPEVYPLDEAIYDAFDAADLVAFELDFDETAAALPLMMQRGMYGPERSLRDDLPADLYADLAARAGALGLPMEVVDRMRPWLVAMTLSAMVLQESGFEARTGLDLHLHERAVAAGQRIMGLESLSMQAQVAFLRSTVEQLDETVAMMDDATAMWLRGDTRGLAEMFVESVGDQPQLMERLLFERNRAWVSQIEELLAQPGTAIVVVGVGHLAGEASVIDLLRQRGYQVTQLRASAPAL
jgi:uncharacterized protein